MEVLVGHTLSPPQQLVHPSCVEEQGGGTSQEEKQPSTSSVFKVLEPVEVHPEKGPLFASTPLPPLSPSINIFMNNVSFTGFHWVEGLKNWSINPLSPLFLSSYPYGGGFTFS